MPGRTDGNDASSSAVSISRRGGGNFPGCSATVHTVYLDNSVLELYHGRLYLRPNARTLKVQWVGRDGSEASEGYVPRKVVIERKIYREGWKGRVLSCCVCCTGEQTCAAGNTAVYVCYIP